MQTRDPYFYSLPGWEGRLLRCPVCPQRQLRQRRRVCRGLQLREGEEKDQGLQKET